MRRLNCEKRGHPVPFRKFVSLYIPISAQRLLFFIFPLHFVQMTPLVDGHAVCHGGLDIVHAK